MEAGECLTGKLAIIDGQKKATLDGAQAIGEQLEIRIDEVEPIPGGRNVRRVDVEQRAGSVVPLDHLLVRPALDLHAIEPFGDSGEQGGKSRAVVVRRLLDCIVEVAAVDASGEA